MDQRESSERFRARREQLRREMGGAARVERIHQRGGSTIRERLDRLFDAGSFTELGTFAPANHGFRVVRLADGVHHRDVARVTGADLLAATP